MVGRFKRSLFIFLTITSATFLESTSILYRQWIQCSKSSEMVALKFPDAAEVLLKDDYEIVIRYTNWLTNTTAKFVERSVNGTIVVKKSMRDSEQILYDLHLHNDDYAIVNSTHIEQELVYLRANITVGGEINEIDCWKVQANEPERNIYEVSPLLADFLGINGTRFSTILEAVVKKEYNSSGLDSSGTNVTAGIETIDWVACGLDVPVHDANFSKAIVQANVYYAGQFSRPFYNTAFKNPIIYSIHLQSYQFEKNGNDTTIKFFDHVSFDVVSMDRIEKSTIDVGLPRGQFCKNMTNTNFPENFPSSFKAHLQYSDDKQKYIDNVEVLFDASELVFSFASNFKSDRDIPFVGHTSFDKNARIIHDFKYGFQYVLSRNGTHCYAIESIDSTMGDVWVDANNTLYIRSPANVLFNLTADNATDFYYGGKIVLNSGLVADSYVSRKPVPGSDGEHIVIEVLYTTNGWEVAGKKSSQLHSVVQYHTNKSGLVGRKTTISVSSLQDYTTRRTQWMYNSVLSCLSTFKEDELFFIALRNVTLSDVQNAGFERVESALVEALAHTGNVSVLRFTSFMFIELHNKLLACFIISEKSNAKPAKTAYLMPELSVDQICDMLNQSINGTATFNVSIPIGEETNNKLVITSNEFGRLPIHNFTPSPTPIIGYTASSMFVLGLFMFIFGAFSMLGCYVFYAKRNQIRGVAYQIFE